MRQDIRPLDGEPEEDPNLHMPKLGRPFLRLIPLVLIAVAPVSRANGGPAASSAASRAPSDWRPVVTGRLGNGVRFAILPRQGHEPGLGLLMRNEGGFIAERRPGERGLAHLIEHVAFLSPTTGAPDDLYHLPHVGGGLTFPAPSAGTTSWRETNYFLSTRTNTTADLDTLLGVLREVATDLTFRRDAVDQGRTQVTQEMAGRKLGNDIYAAYVAAVAPGSPNDVIDAQNSDDVPTASIDTIRGLYGRLYRPANMMIVVVGNVDPAQASELIRKRFGGWKGVGPPLASTPAPLFRPDRIVPISVSTLRQGRRVAFMAVVARTPPPPASRRRQAMATLMDMLAVRAVDNRLARARPGASPGTLGMLIENGEQGHRQIMLWNEIAADEWRPAVAILRRTTCDLRTAGFSDDEWDVARQDVLRDLQESSAAMSAVPNVDLAKDLSHALATHRDLIPPDALLGYARIVLPTVGVRAANRWWRRQWRASVEHLRVEMPELAQANDPIAMIRRTADQAVDAPACKVRR